MRTPDDDKPSLDEAIQSFRRWAEGGDGMDELDFKEYLYETWLPQRFIERSRIKNGWNAKGEKL